MTRKVKIGLGVTLLTGSSGLATSILRFVSFASQSLFPDTPRAAVDLALYTIIETSMYIIAACLPACRPLFNIILHPSRNLPQDQKDGLNSPDDQARTLHDDIELQQNSDTSSGSENGNGSAGGRYHGIGDGFRGMQGRFKRLGSDAGLFLGRRDVSPPSPSQSYPHSQSSSAPSPSPQPQDRDPDRQFLEQAEGRFGLGLSKLRSSSHERIFKAPVSKQQFRAPERVHIANMHVGHMQMSPEEDKERQGGHARDGIRVKQEFDVYYDRPSL
ncbi:putative integral membrane protein [Botrytis cinerea BcDW1]|nr:putative integral membrane protein [Botrytis cinerea BcDW1]